MLRSVPRLHLILLPFSECCILSPSYHCTKYIACKMDLYLTYCRGTPMYMLEHWFLSLLLLHTHYHMIHKVLDDPTGNSYIENQLAPQEDPHLKVQHYERSEQQNRQLGATTATQVSALLWCSPSTVSLPLPAVLGAEYISAMWDNIRCAYMYLTYALYVHVHVCIC